MAKANWRSSILVALFVLGVAATPRAAVADEDIPPLRTKEKMQTIFISLMDTLVGPVPYISSIPINRPFTAVGFEVRGRTDPDAEMLAEFARHAMEIRLGELGVSGQIHIVRPLNPDATGLPPPDVPYCDVLNVTFLFNAAAHDVDGRSVFVIAADMLASQPAAEERSAGEWQCLQGVAAPEGTLHATPRVAVVPGHDAEAAMQQSRALILSFIDSMIVPRLVRTNKTASETFKSWARDGN